MLAQVVRKSANPLGQSGEPITLRCRLMPLFEEYFVNEQVADRDADVVFECRGGSVKGHKVILSIVSKFFADLFNDQKPEEVSVVIVPDIPVTAMRVIVKLCYSENIKLNMTEMIDVGNYLPLFGLSWDQFNFIEDASEDSTRSSLPAATAQSQNISVGSKDGSGQPTSVLETDASTTGVAETRLRLQRSRSMPPHPLVLQQQFYCNGTAGVVEDVSSIDMDTHHDSESGLAISSPEARKSASQRIPSVGRYSEAEIEKEKLAKQSQSTPKSRLSPRAAKPPKKLANYQCQVYQHEMMEHGLIATEDNQSDDDNEQELLKLEEEEEESDLETGTPLLGHLPLPVGEEQNRVTVVKTLNGSRYRRPIFLAAQAKKLITKKYKMPSHSKLHHNSASQSHNKTIGIGAHEGEHLIELKKLKQLHWLYVCSKCDNCANSSAQAIAHHRACYGNDGPKLEDTVTKYRQGFYGQCKCPLCPRKYTSLGRFLLHCGHMHQDYRKTFSHIKTEDVLMCVNCREKYDDPEAFHGHLGSDFTCHRPSRDDEPLDPDGSEGRQRPYARLIGSNPRSARLQNRRLSPVAAMQPKKLANYQCEICKSTFSDPEQWKWHQDHHVGIKRFKCAHCEHVFSNSRQVRQHESICAGNICRRTRRVHKRPVYVESDTDFSSDSDFSTDSDSDEVLATAI